MKGLQILFILLLAIPFAEIYLLLAVGNLIGALPTVLMVVSTAVAGAWLLRQQGFATFQKLQTNLRQGIMPAYEMIEGPIIMLGGALLLTPGFLTDLLGFVCLVPALRRKLAKYLIENHVLRSGMFYSAGVNENNVLEGEFRKDD